MAIIYCMSCLLSCCYGWGLLLDSLVRDLILDPILIQTQFPDPRTLGIVNPGNGEPKALLYLLSCKMRLYRRRHHNNACYFYYMWVRDRGGVRISASFAVFLAVYSIELELVFELFRYSRF